MKTWLLHRILSEPRLGVTRFCSMRRGEYQRKRMDNNPAHPSFIIIMDITGTAFRFLCLIVFSVRKHKNSSSLEIWPAG